MLRVVQAVRFSRLSKVARRYASSFQFLNIKNTDDGYSIIEMHRKPANRMNLQFLDELSSALDSVEKTDGSRGLILTSTLEAFSTGLDLVEFYNPDEERLQIFWSLFQELCLRFYKSPLVTISAINGPAPAGGCALSLCCDYRIMADGKFPIGLTEILVGFWSKLFESTIGHSNAEKMLALGPFYSPQDALQVGFIDAIAPADHLMDITAAVMKQWLIKPEVHQAKAEERREFVKTLVDKKQEDLEDFVRLVNEPLIQETLEQYFRGLLP